MSSDFFFHLKIPREHVILHDRFGDTINTASRMESHGEADRIHVSEATFSLVEKDHPGQFSFQARGQIDIKVPVYTEIERTGSRFNDLLKFRFFFLIYRAKERFLHSG